MPTRRRRPRFDSALRTLRRARTLTQAAMAALLDLSQAHYSRYETGELLPPLAQRERIAVILGTTPRELWPPPPEADPEPAAPSSL